MRHYLSELDFDAEETRSILSHAQRLKRDRGEPNNTLAGKHVALYFEKPSVRTRISFTVGVHGLGGHVVELGPSNTKVGKGEDEEDFAQVLGRYVHCLVARVFAQDKLVRMAAHAGVPVVNALSDERHPCQALADLLTIQERLGRIDGQRIAFIGEGNNVATSTGLLAAALGAEVHVASPAGYGLPPAVLAQAARLPGKLVQDIDPKEAARGAHVLYTDTWISMGQEAEAGARRLVFAGYRIDERLLELAADNAIVMHCLPAVRDEEIATSVMRGPASAIWDQAENRLHVQKALLCALLSEPVIHQLLTLQAERGADLAPDTVARALERGLRASGFSPGAHFEHRWSPQGQTLASSSSEHRLILHTWPERGAVTLDLYGEPERLAGLAEHIALSLGCAPIQRLSRERP